MNTIKKKAKVKKLKLKEKVRMESKKSKAIRTIKQVGSNFFERSWEQSWTYIKTVVDVVHEPVLILDKDFRVIAANQVFYEAFRVEPIKTEGSLVYELGNGQWDIPDLKKLLEDILPKHTFFHGFKVVHDFPEIGRREMILNARQIHQNRDKASKPVSSIILLAIEDITEMMTVAKKLADHTNMFEAKLTERTLKLEIHIKELEKEIDVMKRGF